MKPNWLFEAVNGAIFVMVAWATYVFAGYIWRNRHRGYTFLAPALAMGGFFFFETFIRLAYWWVRREINRGDFLMQVSPWWTISGTLGLIVFVSLIIRIFDSEDSEGWAWALIWAIVFVMASFIVPYDWPSQGY